MVHYLNNKHIYQEKVMKTDQLEREKTRIDSWAQEVEHITGGIQTIDIFSRRFVHPEKSGGTCSWCDFTWNQSFLQPFLCSFWFEYFANKILIQSQPIGKRSSIFFRKWLWNKLYIIYNLHVKSSENKYHQCCCAWWRFCLTYTFSSFAFIDTVLEYKISIIFLITKLKMLS